MPSHDVLAILLTIILNIFGISRDLGPGITKDRSDQGYEIPIGWPLVALRN